MAGLFSRRWICYLDETIYYTDWKLKASFTYLNTHIWMRHTLPHMLFNSDLFQLLDEMPNTLPGEDMSQYGLVLSLRSFVINISPCSVLKVISCSTITQRDILMDWDQGVRLKMSFKHLPSFAEVSSELVEASFEIAFFFIISVLFICPFSALSTWLFQEAFCDNTIHHQCTKPGAMLSVLMYHSLLG